MAAHQNFRADETSKAKPLRYTRVAIILHWMIAVLILFNLSLGFFMEGFAPSLRGVVIPLHISAGITVLTLTVVRVAWRLTHRPPPHAEGMRRWEDNLASFTHFLLYAAMVLMPLTGWAILSAHPPAGSPGAVAEAAARAGPAGPTAAPAPPRGGGPKIWGVIPLLMISAIQEIAREEGGVPPQKKLHQEFVGWHGVGGYLLLLLLLLHVGGALKHQWIDQKAELERMGMPRFQHET